MALSDRFKNNRTIVGQVEEQLREVDMRSIPVEQRLLVQQIREDLDVLATALDEYALSHL